MIKNYTIEQETQIKELADKIDTGANMLGEWISELFKLYVDEEFPGENEWFGPDFTRMLGYLWALQNDLYAAEMLRNVADQEDLEGRKISLGLQALIRLQGKQNKPKIVCLCGSTRFSEAFQDNNLYETLKGNIVLSIGCNTKSDDDLVKAGIAINKEALDTLHLWKILIADEVLVLDVNDYTGESTKREIEYAQMLGKTVRYLSEEGNKS
jgi:hypothetical protein